MTEVVREFAGWVEHVHELLERPTGPTFPWVELADHLAQSIDGGVSWHWINPDGTAGFELCTPADAEFWGTVEVTTHPLFLWYRAGDLRPTTVDPGSGELGQQLCIPYRLSPAGFRFFLLARARARTDSSDFSDEDVELACRIQPLIALLARHFTLDRATDRTTYPARISGGSTDVGLSTRETAVLRLLAEGHTAGAIGRRLYLSPRTVHVHLSHIYRKLGVHDRLQAVLVAARLGLLDDHPEGTGFRPAGHLTDLVRSRR